MKAFVVSLAAAAGLWSASASAADLRWQGTLFVTDAPAACGSNAAVGDQWTFVFRAADDGQALSIIGQRRAMAFVPAGGIFKKSGNYDGTFIGSNAIPRTATAKYSGFKLVPGAPDEGDRTVLISAKILGFDGAPGCDVTVEAAGVRRPGY